MRKISWFLIGLILFSCHKEDINIPPGLSKGGQYLSEVWTNGVLTTKYEYANGRMVKYGGISFTYVGQSTIDLIGYNPHCFSFYNSDNQLNGVHYFTEAYWPKQDKLTWEQGKLIEYKSTQSALLSSTDQVYIDSFKYRGDNEVEISSHWMYYVHNVKTSGGLSRIRVYKWLNPFLLREMKGENNYIEYRFSPVVKSANYNITNFPWLTNKIGIDDKSDLMNMLVSNSFTVGYIRVSSRMLMMEEREVVNGKHVAIRRVENLRTSKEKLPVSYDVKDMASGTVTHYEFKYIAL